MPIGKKTTAKSKTKTKTTARKTTASSTSGTTKKAASKTIRTTKTSSRRAKKAPTHDEIANRAREIWHQEGCPHGREVENWLQAERELSS